MGGVGHRAHHAPPSAAVDELDAVRGDGGAELRRGVAPRRQAPVAGAAENADSSHADRCPCGVDVSMRARWPARKLSAPGGESNGGADPRQRRLTLRRKVHGETPVAQVVDSRLRGNPSVFADCARGRTRRTMRRRCVVLHRGARARTIGRYAPACVPRSERCPRTSASNAISTSSTGCCRPWAPYVRRVIARNPSPFTFHGTGTYVVGHGRVAVIDPGPALDDHIEALVEGLRGETVTHVLVTHTHRDHSPGCALLRRFSPAPTYGYGPHGSGWPAAGDRTVVVEEGADFRVSRPMSTCATAT